MAKGIGCVSCHGRVDEMPLTWKTETLYMTWCLDCHRHPERAVRPRREVFNLKSPNPSPEKGARLLRLNNVRSPHFLLDCGNCHR